MKKKLLTILVAVAAAMSLFVSACAGNNDESAHEHSWSTEWSSDGTHHWHVCDGCDSVTDRATHTYGSWVVTTPATETTEGEQQRSCIECGYTQRQAVPVLGHTHSWVSTWSSDESGHWHACSGCSERSDEASHTYKDGECEVCGYEDPDYTPGHVHDWSEEWSSDVSGHWHACLNGCGETNDNASHTYKNGECEVCGYEDPNYTPGHEHNWSTEWSSNEDKHWHACLNGCDETTDEGSHTYLNGACIVCGRVDPDYSVHEHTWSQEWSKDPNYHWQTCTGCDATTGKSAHTYGEWVTQTPATDTSDGKRVKTCTVCGYQIFETIPATGTTPPAVEGNIEIIEAQGHLESAYVMWESDSNFSWYNVYCKADGADDSSYVKLDNPLIRQYPTYFRADAVGLEAGDYTLKIVPVDGDDKELTNSATTVSNLSVLAHDRSGFAFVNGTSSGAYNEDGTLRSNARVIYITEETKDSVSLEVTGANSNPCVGLQEILNGYAKGKETRPLAVRLVGNITDFDVMEDGDILIATKNNNVGITFEGIGSDATANGWGLRLKNATNVEVRNLGFMNCDSGEGDNIGLQQENDHIWVHNCDLFYGDAGSDADQVKGDGALDTKKSSYITHSYNHFWDSGKCNLQGMKSEKTTNYITYHHNWYDHSDSRHPRIRTCTVHIYNNYFDGNAKYGVGVTMGASAFVENNYFRSTTTMKPMMSAGQGTDGESGGKGTFSGEDGGIIKSFGNIYDSPDLLLKTYQDYGNNSDCYEASSRDEKVPSSYTTVKGGTTYNNFDTDSSLMYEYTVDSAEEAKAKVEKYAGRIGGGDFKYDFDDETEDGNYAVIDELKAMLVNYSSDLVKIGGGSVIEGGGSSEEGGETGGETGGEQGGQTPAPVEGAVIVTFDGGQYDYKGQKFITVDGNTSTSKGSITYNGVTYSTCLKMESSTTISFSVAEDAELELYFGKDDADSDVKINGMAYTADSNGVVKVSLTAGTSYTIKKGDSMNLFVIVLSPVE